MILQNCNGFPISGRLLGIDWGARRTGIAVSDASREFVFVRDAVIADSKSVGQVEKIISVIAQESVKGIVLGLPVSADGSDTNTSAKVRAFAKELSEKIDLPIMFVEENLTSMNAQENLGKVRIAELKQKLDSESARVILENAIAIINRAAQ